MPSPLTPEQEESLRAALATARAAAAAITATSPTADWLSVLRPLLAAIQDLPGSDQIRFLPQVLSFADTSKKKAYYRALEEGGGGEEEEAANTSAGAAMSQLRGGCWNLLLSCSETGALGSQNAWHCAAVLRHGSQWTIYTTIAPAAAEGRETLRRGQAAAHSVIFGAITHRHPRAFHPPSSVSLAMREGVPAEGDCIRFSLGCIITLVEGIMLGVENPRVGGDLGGLRVVDIVP